MSDYIITIPDRYFPNSDTFRDVYYPDERHNPMPLEEIVRCRDCVHAEPEKEPPRKGYEGLLWCDYLTEGIGFSVLPYNFCAWGERKEGGDD